MSGCPILCAVKALIWKMHCIWQHLLTALGSSTLYTLCPQHIRLMLAHICRMQDLGRMLWILKYLHHDSMKILISPLRCICLAQHAIVCTFVIKLQDYFRFRIMRWRVDFIAILVRCCHFNLNYKCKYSRINFATETIQYMYNIIPTSMLQYLVFLFESF